jgi:hypothetical protein
MAEIRIVINSVAGVRLDFAVERIADGMYHRAGAGWVVPAGAAPWVEMDQDGPTIRSAPLPPLAAGQTYCLHVIEYYTRRLVMSQLLDDRGRVIAAPAGGWPSGRQPPRNEYRGGYTIADRRHGRNIDLE